MALNLNLIFLILQLILGSTSATFVTSDKFKAGIIANISSPRGLLVDESGDILVLSRGSSSVIALYKENSNFTQTLIINGTTLELSHGIAYNSEFLYASSGSTVYRWPYKPGQRSLVTKSEEIIISNISIPDTNKWNTRTLIFDTNNLLYVTINSDIRLDNDSHRCRIRRFNITTLPDNGRGIDFEKGEIFADGLRNEVGLAFDSDGVLWGVENAGGIDYLIREDLGGNIHDGNPAEEINRFDKALGTHYGYPYCFGSYDLKGYPVGTQFAWPTAMNDGIHTDDWCRQESNNERAIFFMPPHEAPLGLEFYSGINCDKGEGAFPCSAKGNALIAFHGSMNITIPVGYKVAMYTYNPETKMPTGEKIDIIYDASSNNDVKLFRPVNAVFNKLGHLIVSSDTSNEVIRITYNNQSDKSGSSSRQVGNIIYTLYIFFVSWIYFY